MDSDCEVGELGNRDVEQRAPDQSLPEHVQQNREAWDKMAADFVDHGHHAWASNAVSWGIFSVPEEDLHLLPEDLAGKDAIELGCGTAYISSWLARRGAKPVGIDNSPKQLETARRLRDEFDLHFPLHLGNAETTPFADASFDFAISEYGASIWCDPYQWIPEAARLLRPGGELVFLLNGHLLMLCSDTVDEDAPADDRLKHPLFGTHRFSWKDSSTEFVLSHGQWIRLLRNHGFEIEALIEVRPREGATTSYPYVSYEWSRKWPCEEVWKVRKR